MTLALTSGEMCKMTQVNPPVETLSLKEQTHSLVEMQTGAQANTEHVCVLTHTKTHTLRELLHVQVTTISQPPISRIHKGSVLWGIAAPEVSLNASSSPPPPLSQGMAFVHFHALLLFRYRVGVGRGHGEVILSPH